MPANVQTMFSGSGEVPWHKLGAIVQGTPTSEEAIRLAGLDWHVEKHPLFARIPTAKGDDGKEHGVFKRADSMFATVRMDSKTVLGLVGSQYTPVQNKDCFAMLDSLVADGAAQYETAGALGNGSTVWMLLRSPEDLVVAGDTVRPYFLATTSHDGTGRVRVRNVSTRVVCANTLAMAMGEDVRHEFVAGHTKSVHARMQQAAKVLGLIGDTTKAFVQEANGLLARSFSAAEFRALADRLIPKPDEKDPLTTDRMVKSWSQRMDGLMRDAYLARDLDNVRNTAWGALNAVADYEQHVLRITGDESKKLETLFRRSFLEGELTRKAYALITA